MAPYSLALNEYLLVFPHDVWLYISLELLRDITA